MDGQGLNFLAGLQNALGRECPECGETNPSSAEYCEICGAPLPMEEEEESFSIVHAEGVYGGMDDEVRETPEELIFIDLNREENLAFLQETINRSRQGDMSYADYRSRIKKIEAMAKTGVDKFFNDAVMEKAELMPEMQRNLFMRMASYFEEYLKGCSRMLDYDGGADGTPAMEGILAAERALNNLEKMQKKAEKLVG